MDPLSLEGKKGDLEFSTFSSLGATKGERGFHKSVGQSERERESEQAATSQQLGPSHPYMVEATTVGITHCLMHAQRHEQDEWGGGVRVNVEHGGHLVVPLLRTERAATQCLVSPLGGLLVRGGRDFTARGQGERVHGKRRIPNLNFSQSGCFCRRCVIKKGPGAGREDKRELA